MAFASIVFGLLLATLAQSQDQFLSYMPLDAPEMAELMAQERNGGAIRDPEYLPQSSLWGHKFMQGGAGEGQQMLSPMGLFENREEVKTDAVLPAYCDPPNPCPPGFTSDDGCLEDFENSADFSQKYQAKQDCMCDEEHMFNCPRKVAPMASPMDQGNYMSVNDMIEAANEQALQGGMIAKKDEKDAGNPYILGEKLPYIVAKKG